MIYGVKDLGHFSVAMILLSRKCRGSTFHSEWLHAESCRTRPDRQREQRRDVLCSRRYSTQKTWSSISPAERRRKNRQSQRRTKFSGKRPRMPPCQISDLRRASAAKLLASVARQARMFCFYSTIWSCLHNVASTGYIPPETWKRYRWQPQGALQLH